MTTWNELKKELTSISPEEMTAIDSLAYLHAQRIKQGISQVELAKRIGMKQPQLAKIENLTSIPSLETLNRYAKGLGLHAVITFKPLTTA
ncbi:helix-turn-helix transcriptional regulator [Lactobacillus crispatus]|jgi:xre family toxin-antitoxin system|uniref:helix-turn-helix domain-containing protein n=1 Tax=Lactobacillus crispatus TaxID=47770 RepID=UPI000398EB7D|nr:helix-turn-helix transcriptional regulator [Lactobacillus crispatus]KWU15792.1 transcriptional regulator [Lactobacillus crispatus]KWX61149.1 transcriptional regulator [Lactobacillus crispatus]MBG0734890.1 helix-turn-helix transcriptional regulator [Lactobacillus crispatus]MBI1702631.1 XRE family transcriptional regulator [Lactobacillus crispatus]MBI1705557.1 XRE family transcriptional regulator [Lactobacillus crispatus]